MQCPVCNVDLVLSERQGVEIDYCPKCRGVWLDRGELDKIIDRVVEATPAPSSRMPADTRGYDRERNDRDHDREHDRHYDHGHHDDDYYKHKRKRGGLLGELFDF